MSTEPKPEKTTLADLARALDSILYPHLNPLVQVWPRLMQIATQVCVAFRAAGWIGPEEAAAREAAARREALLEARRSVAVIRTPLNNLVGLSRAQAFHVGVGEVATLLDNTLLAEPERDEEGGR